MKTLRATRNGYDGIGLIKAGETFEWPDNKPIPSWAQNADEPFEADEERAAAAATSRRDRISEAMTAKEPRTLGEAQRRNREPRPASA